MTKKMNYDNVGLQTMKKGDAITLYKVDKTDKVEINRKRTSANDCIKRAITRNKLKGEFAITAQPKGKNLWIQVNKVK